MAFQSVNQNSGDRYAESRKASEMGAGDVVQGYLVRIEPSGGEFEGYNYILSIDGALIRIYGTGTMKYAAKDGKLKNGLMTRITAKGKQPKVSKAGRKYTISEFDIEQDPEDAITTESTGTVTSIATTEASSAAATGIKAQAQRLAAAAKTSRG